MNCDDLKALCGNGESEILELKRSTSTLRSAAQTICGFLNARGGRVVFGATAEGELVGQQVSDKTVEDVAREIREIDPPVFPRIDRVDCGHGMEAILITVEPGQMGPYSVRNTAYRRVGNTTVELSRETYNQMVFERQHAVQRWETEPASEWTVESIDELALVRTVEEAIRRGRASDPGTRDPAALLRMLGLQRNDRMLRAAVVLYGRDREVEARMPQLLLRLARFRGIEKTEFIDNRQYCGHAFRLMMLAESFLRDHLPIAGRVVPGLFERKDDPLYPILALRETLANAICHRDYSIGGGSISIGVFDDRLEVTSSGSLHFGLTPEALFREHDSLPWNPLIASVLFRVGFVERWGRGTIVMAELTKSAGLPRPEIEDRGGCVTVRFRPSHYIPPDKVQRRLSDRQRAILAAISDLHSPSLRDLRERLKGVVPAWAVQEELGNLKNLGLVSTGGHGRGAYWFLTERR